METSQLAPRSKKKRMVCSVTSHLDDPRIREFGYGLSGDSKNPFYNLGLIHDSFSAHK